MKDKNPASEQRAGFVFSREPDPANPFVPSVGATPYGAAKGAEGSTSAYRCHRMMIMKWKFIEGRGCEKSRESLHHHDAGGFNGLITSFFVLSER